VNSKAWLAAIAFSGRKSAKKVRVASAWCKHEWAKKNVRLAPHVLSIAQQESGLLMFGVAPTLELGFCVENGLLRRRQLCIKRLGRLRAFEHPGATRF